MYKGKDAKPHIGIFGRRNNGKSSLINSLTGQETAIVSAFAGTTTDPVKKSVEIPGIGASVVIDTAGFDDSGELGNKRVERTLDVLNIIDMAILVIAENSLNDEEAHFITLLQDEELPFMIVHNKSDISPLSAEMLAELEAKYEVPVLDYSSTHPNPDQLRETMRRTIPESAFVSKGMLGDIIKAGDTVLLITPIDLEAPEGRMILPQMQAVRDVLDNDAVVTLIKEDIAKEYIAKMFPKPVLVVTDSQVFPKANDAVPPEIHLTSFSIVLARQRGDFEQYQLGTPKIGALKDGDRVLILESCTHHVTCDDIGRVKIPKWLKNFTGKDIHCDVVSGLDRLPKDIQEYALVIQCGGCMITRRQIHARLKPAIKAGIPVTNYGMAIAWMHGIYERAMKPFLLTTTEKDR